MTVKEIVEKYLKENGYDGLYCHHECGCLVGDFFIPSDCDGISQCEAGYKYIETNEESDFYGEEVCGPDKPKEDKSIF